MIIKELNIEETDLIVEGVSLVKEPAIETEFDFYAKIKPGTSTSIEENRILFGTGNKPLWYRYSERPGAAALETQSREFCKRRVGNVYFVDEIKKWATSFDASYRTANGFNEDTYQNMFETLYQLNMNEALFGCRHYLEPVTSVSQIPEWKVKLFTKQIYLYNKEEQENNNITTRIDFKIIDNSRRIIEGAVMLKNKFIYRTNIDGKKGNNGYVYFKENTIDYLRNRFDSLTNKYIALDHKNILGKNQYEILDNYMRNGNWYMKVKILDDKIWEMIKLGKWKGFSIELFVTR